MNIFAYELSNILEQHKQYLGGLSSFRGLDGAPLVTPAKVARLSKSLSDEVTAVLSDGEITLVAAAVGMTEQEERRLRAALIGEAVRKMLLGRVATVSAMEEGERVVGLVMAEEEEAVAVREELADVPVETSFLQSRPSADTNAKVATALEMVAEACEQGELWLAVATRAPDADQREAMLGVAWQWLDRAAQFLAFAPEVAQGSTHQEEWRRTVEGALNTIHRLRGHGA